VDVWAPEFDPTTVFDQESLAEITAFFMSNVKGGITRGEISLKDFSAWDDVKAMMDEGVMTEKLLKVLIYINVYMYIIHICIYIYL
jgi:hypothetical protein